MHLTSAKILSRAFWYSSSRSSIDLLLLSSFSFIRIWNTNALNLQYMKYYITLICKLIACLMLALLAALHLPCCRLCLRWSCPVLRCSASGNHPSCRLWCVRKTFDLVCTRRGNRERNTNETLSRRSTVFTTALFRHIDNPISNPS